MAHKKLTNLVTLFVTLVLALTFVNGAIAITPSSVDKNLTIGSPVEVEYTVTNTGTQAVNLSISSKNPTLNSDTIAVSLSKSQLTNLAPSASQTFKATYSASSSNELGIYSGSINVTNPENSESVQSTTLLNVQIPAGASLKTSEDNNTVEIRAKVNEKETEIIRLYNDGTVDLNNIKFKFSDLTGKHYGDEIEDSDLDIDEDNFDLDVGDSQRLEIEVDVPKGIEADTYTGTLTATSQEGYKLEIKIEVEIDGGDIEVEFVNDFYVKNGKLEIVAEPDEKLDYEIRVENNGDVNARDLKIAFKKDLEEINSDETLDISGFRINPDDLDIEYDDYEEFDLEIDIPENQKAGTYIGEIQIYQIKDNNKKDILDELQVEVKVVGDVYISEIKYDRKAIQNEYLDVDVTIKNQGTDNQRRVKVTGTIIGIDRGNSDLVDSSNTFLLTAGQTRTETLRFDIPQEAQDGLHTLEIKLSYDDGTVTELEEVEVSRPDSLLQMVSSGIGQNIIKCDDSLFVFAKVKNIGKYDQKADFSVEVLGTGIKKEIKDINIDVDESIQQNFNLAVKDLEKGTYDVVTKVNYNGFFAKETNTLIVKDCTETSTGIVVKPDINGGNNDNNETIDTEKTYELFGQTLDQTQIYLIMGISIIFVLIVISLFFI